MGWTAQAAALLSPDPSGRATAAPRASRTAVRSIEAPGLQTWAPESVPLRARGSGSLDRTICFGGVRMERLRGLKIPCKQGPEAR